MSLKEFAAKSSVFLLDPEGLIYKPVEELSQKVLAKFVVWNKKTERREKDQLIVLPPNLKNGNLLLHGEGLAVDLNLNNIHGYPLLDPEIDSKGLEHNCPVPYWEKHYQIKAAGYAIVSPMGLVLGEETRSKTYEIKNSKKELTELGGKIGFEVNQDLFNSAKKNLAS